MIAAACRTGGRLCLFAAVVMGVSLRLLLAPASALDVPPLTGRIVDAAHLLPADLAATLSADLAAHEERTGNQVVLLTIRSLEGEALEEYSHRVATTWKLGQKGIDNGVLLLVVPADRRIRIEVGYGLEGTLTDARASRIIREEMVPRFRSGDVAGGITAGLKAVLGTLEGTYTPTERKRALDRTAVTGPWDIFLLAVVVGILTSAITGVHRRGPGGWIGSLLAFFLGLSAGWLLAVAAAVSVFVLALVLPGLPLGGRWSPYSGLGGSWGSGGIGGFSGSFSGGGGDFGGGGASGQW